MIQYHPIDDAAKNGKSHLVKDETGGLWCARWQNKRWYCGAYPIEARTAHIVEYAKRTKP